MIARLLAMLAAAVGRTPVYADQPFDGPCLTLQVPVPTRPGPFDWATDAEDRGGV